MRATNIFSTTGLLFVLGAMLFSCEDPIDIPSDFESPQLVVDAWIQNTNSPQTIVLTETVDYFAGGQPKGVTNATVLVCRSAASNCFEFDHEGDGRYTWLPEGGETLGSVGDSFELNIEVDGQTYTSETLIARTATIDSIGLNFEEESLQFTEGIYAQAYVFDPIGRGDTYWMKTYKNDTLLNRASELVVTYDATFDAGADIDGTYFIPPLRFGANPFDDDGMLIPYVPGDEIRVEVHSISLDAFRFLNIATEQILNEGIFAVPLANSPSNIVNSSTGEAALGIFNIAEVVSLERIVE